MANLITLARFCLLFLLIGMAYRAPAPWQLLDAPLVIFIIALDGLDGYVARRRGETSVFGSIFDIAVDRAVENVLWIVLGDLGLIPMWVAIVFVCRGAIVDTIRYAVMSGDATPFGIMHSPLGKMLVASRAMRGIYGGVKTATFAWVLLLQPLQMLAAAWWQRWSDVGNAVTSGLIGASVALCLLRGMPVVVEFVLDQRIIRPRGPAPAATGGRSA